MVVSDLQALKRFFINEDDDGVAMGLPVSKVGEISRRIDSIYVMMCLPTEDLISRYEVERLSEQKQVIAKVILHRCMEAAEPDSLADEYYLSTLRDAHGPTGAAALDQMV